jgi:uncharacterized protein YndB with AHSA1/START domain
MEPLWSPAVAMTRREYTTTRVLDAPRELLSKAWTEPEQLAQWWGPKGMGTPIETIELDLRPGGAFQTRRYFTRR